MKNEVDSYYGNPKDGQTIQITAQLTPSAQTGNIQVVSTQQSGALVTLNRSWSANTPYTFTNIRVGTHQITVYMSGYQDFYMDINVNKGQTAYVNAILQPAVTTGTLSVSSSPSGAAVYVDGSYRGVTSTWVGNLNRVSFCAINTGGLPGLDRNGYHIGRRNNLP